LRCHSYCAIGAEEGAVNCWLSLKVVAIIS
jgi:hypothetical protein